MHCDCACNSYCWIGVHCCQVVMFCIDSSIVRCVSCDEARSARPSGRLVEEVAEIWTLRVLRRRWREACGCSDRNRGSRVCNGVAISRIDGGLQRPSINVSWAACRYSQARLSGYSDNGNPWDCCDWLASVACRSDCGCRSFNARRRRRDAFRYRPISRL